MLLNDFGNRARECLVFARHAHSSHDRELFIAMARAWCGVGKESQDKPADTSMTESAVSSTTRH